MFRILVFVQCILIFTGCFSFDGIGECGKDIEIGEYQLGEQSFEYFTYDKDDVLIFEDQEGAEVTFKFFSERTLRSSKHQVNELCREGLLDAQFEYFESQEKRIIFHAEDGESYLRIGLSLGTTSEEEIDDKVIFDNFSIIGYIENMGTSFHGSVATGYHQNGPIEINEDNFYNNGKMVSDTTINSKLYEQIFSFKQFNGTSVFYTKRDGIFLITDENKNYLRLKN